MSRAAVAGRAVVAAVALAAATGCGGDPPPPEGAPEPAVMPIERGLLRVAGSGTMVPLMRALGAAFRARSDGGPRVVVEDSVGSGGGIRAALDGAIDIGLASRRLTAREASWPLVVLPLGRDAVILAANPDVTAEGLTSAEVIDLFEGRRRSFGDGSPATVLLRDRSESANLALDAAIAGMAAARERAYHLGFRVLYHDDAMAAALAVTPGGVGVYSLGLLRATRIPIKVLTLDGKAASLASLADGSWPLSRPLALVLRVDRVEHATRFLAFATSAAGRRIIADSGYLAIDHPGDERGRPLPASRYAAQGAP